VRRHHDPGQITSNIDCLLALCKEQADCSLMYSFQMKWGGCFVLLFIHESSLKLPVLLLAIWRSSIGPRKCNHPASHAPRLLFPPLWLSERSLPCERQPNSPANYSTSQLNGHQRINSIRLHVMTELDGLLWGS